MMHYKIEKPPLWKTVGTVFLICFIGLFVCVYMLFSGIHRHDQKMEQTENELQETRIELQQTKMERGILQQKIDILEKLEYERGTLPSPPPPTEIR